MPVFDSSKSQSRPIQQASGQQAIRQPASAERIVYEDEFLKITSLMVKPLVELGGMLKLKVLVTTMNKTYMNIPYLYQRYYGPKSNRGLTEMQA